MNDQERMTAFKERLERVEGLDERSFRTTDRWSLERTNNRAGYDDQGRLKVAMFDAKSYDIESFERHNDGRFAIHSIQASLSQDTVHAAEDCKVVCIFVNDQCDDAIVSCVGRARRRIDRAALRRFQ